MKPRTRCDLLPLEAVRNRERKLPGAAQRFVSRRPVAGRCSTHAARCYLDGLHQRRSSALIRWDAPAAQSRTCTPPPSIAGRSRVREILVACVCVLLVGMANDVLVALASSGPRELHAGSRAGRHASSWASVSTRSVPSCDSC